MSEVPLTTITIKLDEDVSITVNSPSEKPNLILQRLDSLLAGLQERGVKCKLRLPPESVA